MENSGTEHNPLGHEDAHRIRLQIAWMDCDSNIHEFFVRMSSSNYSPLERACFATSIWEYSTGVLPRSDGEPFEGRHRRDLNYPIGEQGVKAWHKDQPEMADWKESVFETTNYVCICGENFTTPHALTQHRNESPDCKDASAAASAKITQVREKGVHRHKCLNPACNSRFPNWAALTYHLGTVTTNGRGDTRTSHVCQVAMNALGIYTAADLEAHKLDTIFDESLFSTGFIAALKKGKVNKQWKCLGCGHQIHHLNHFKGHLGYMLGKRKLTDKMLECREDCGVTDVSQIKTLCLNPFYVSTR